MSKVVVPLAEGFEEIEAVTIIDVLRRAGIEVVVAGIGSDRIKGSHHIQIQCDCLIEEIDIRTFDGIVLPGGMPGTTNLMQATVLRGMIIDVDKQEKLVAAVCAAPTVLCAAGVLEGRKATCYPDFKDDMIDLTWSDEDVVIDDHVITSRGPGTVLAFSLALVTFLAGKEKADILDRALLFNKG